MERNSDFFINQSPSDDELFPYWLPEDSLRRKFDLNNIKIRQFLTTRMTATNFTRNPGLVSIYYNILHVMFCPILYFI